MKPTSLLALATGVPLPHSAGSGQCGTTRGDTRGPRERPHGPIAALLRGPQTTGRRRLDDKDHDGESAMDDK